MTNFRIISIFYFLGITALSFIWFLIYKALEKSNNKLTSATAKFLAYRKMVAILLGVPYFLIAFTLFFSDWAKNEWVNFLAVPITFIPLVIFIFTIYRRRVIALTEEIRKENPTAGSMAELTAGFSSNYKDTLILFAILAIGIILIILSALLLIKSHII